LAADYPVVSPIDPDRQSQKRIRKPEKGYVFRKDHNTTGEYRRLPNHLMATRKTLVQQVRFQHTNFGEDSDYSRRLKPLLKTEFAIPKVLYHYEYNDETTETRNG